MKQRISKDDALPSTILAALAELDQKGTDEKITRAMSIVFEAFRLHATKRSFSAEDLLAAVICR
jgi:hypothetical protein